VSKGDRHAKYLWRRTIVSKSEADEFNDGGEPNIAKVGVSWLGWQSGPNDTIPRDLTVERVWILQGLIVEI